MDTEVVDPLPVAIISTIYYDKLRRLIVISSYNN